MFSIHKYSHAHQNTHVCLSVCLSLYASADDPLFLVCKRGDLLQVDKEKSAPNESCFIATNKRTGSSGAVYKKILLFLPTVTEPTSEMLVKLTLPYMLSSYD